MQQSTIKPYKQTGLEVAVIGMAARFPGAADIGEFWNNLIDGVESITFFTDRELLEAGVPGDALRNPDYVRGKGRVEGEEHFDSAFFNYSPREARIMDPQIRVFHEVAWAALEDAGYDPGTYKGNIGLYAGYTPNLTWNLLVSLQGRNALEYMEQRTLNNNYFTTLICYRLNLKGPGVTLNTACSTSLTAIHQACRGLLTGESDMVLAGGVTLHPRKNGYYYREGMINSSDGHNRTFDARADGTVPSSGAGVVVLKRLVKAEKDGDHIYAAVKGTAINNDGNRKAGYTAPSVDGQAQVIRAAQRIGGVEPATVSYIETHGTATPLGDPIEVEALMKVFKGLPRESIRLGSVKSNVGHMDAAAGVGGFIKTVLSLYHRIIPPSLHFKTPNPRINWDNSPFKVNADCYSCEPGQFPLRAGVSSFGIGGTNAHVVLEEVVKEKKENYILQITDSKQIANINIQINEKGDRREKNENNQKGTGKELLILSAKTPGALERMTTRLKDFLVSNPNVHPGHVAYTLQVGRAVFPYRRFVVFGDAHDAVERLDGIGGRFDGHYDGESEAPVIFMFPGLGDQYAGMGMGFYRDEPVFKDAADRCFGMIQSITGRDISGLFRGEAGTGSETESVGESLRRFDNAQFAVFTFEYALAQLVLSWGIRPHGMIGYSFGEYTAACIAGVFSLEDTLRLIAVRGRLIEALPAGEMLSVPMNRERLRGILENRPVGKKVWLAIDNGASCVVSGEPEAVAEFNTEMKKNRILCMKVPATHALHTQLMEPVLAPLAAELQLLRPNEPEIPFISNVTGTWITAEQVLEPRYWLDHLRNTVRFAPGLETVLSVKNAILLEVGPGSALSTLASGMAKNEPGRSSHAVINTVRFPGQKIGDREYLLGKIGRMWLNGYKPAFSEYYKSKGEKRLRVPLPSYPFETVPYPVDESAFGEVLQNMGQGVGIPGLSSVRGVDISERYYVPSWKPGVLPALDGESIKDTRGLVFMDESGVGDRTARYLEETGAKVVRVKAGGDFEAPEIVDNGMFIMDPSQEFHYGMLLDQLAYQGKTVDWILHLWGISPNTPGVAGFVRDDHDPGRNRDQLNRGFYSMVHLGRALMRQGNTTPGAVKTLRLVMVTDHLHDVTGRDANSPLKAPGLAVMRFIRRLLPHVETVALDIEHPGNTGNAVYELNQSRLTRRLCGILTHPDPGSVVALRANKYLIRTVEPVRLDSPVEPGPLLKKNGVYVVTNGTGGAGLLLAFLLAREQEARLILTDSSTFPRENQWDEWLAGNSASPGQPMEPVSTRITLLKRLKTEAGALEIRFMDLSQPGEAVKLVSDIREQFGAIDGVIHTTVPLEGIKVPDILESGIDSTFELEWALRDIRPDFFIFVSPMSGNIFDRMGNNIMGGTTPDAGSALAQIELMGLRDFFNGFSAYHTAACEIDARGITPVRSINWDSLWGEESEGFGIWNRLIHSDLSRVMVSMQDLKRQLDASSRPRSDENREIETPPEQAYMVPKKQTEYVAPRDEAEQALVEAWEDILGTKPVGIHDNFFHLGGDSLKGMMFVNRFQEMLGEIVHITIIFDAPTPAELAAYFKRHYPEGYRLIAGDTDREEAGIGVMAEPEETLTVEKIERIRRRMPVHGPVMINGDKNPPAVFVLSPPRTGSTLLRVMLAGHPGLFAPPELNLMQFATLRERKQALSGHSASHLQGTVRAVMQVKGCEVEEAEEIIRHFEEKGMTIHRFYGRLQEWAGERLLVDKSPGYSRNTAFMRRIETYFREARYIHLLRHPYGMINSYLEARMDLLTGEHLMDGMNLSRREIAEMTWVINLQNILEFLREVPGERQLTIKFEDIALQPETAARDICRFLNLEYHPGMVEPYAEKEQRMTDALYDGGIMMGDPKFHRHKGIDPAVADNWKKNITEDFLGVPARELARQLNYPLIIGNPLEQS